MAQSQGTKIRLDAHIEQAVWDRVHKENTSLNRIVNELLFDWLDGRRKTGHDAGIALVKQIDYIRSLAETLAKQATQLDRTIHEQFVFDAIAAAGKVEEGVFGRLGGVDTDAEGNTGGAVKAG